MFDQASNVTWQKSVNHRNSKRFGCAAVVKYTPFVTSKVRFVVGRCYMRSVANSKKHSQSEPLCQLDRRIWYSFRLVPPVTAHNNHGTTYPHNCANATNIFRDHIFHFRIVHVSFVVPLPPPGLCHLQFTTYSTILSQPFCKAERHCGRILSKNVVFFLPPTLVYVRNVSHVLHPKVCRIHIPYPKPYVIIKI